MTIDDAKRHIEIEVEHARNTQLSLCGNVSRAVRAIETGDHVLAATALQAHYSEVAGDIQAAKRALVQAVASESAA